MVFLPLPSLPGVHLYPCIPVATLMCMELNLSRSTAFFEIHIKALLFRVAYNEKRSINAYPRSVCTTRIRTNVFVLCCTVRTTIAIHAVPSVQGNISQCRLGHLTFKYKKIEGKAKIVK